MRKALILIVVSLMLLTGFSVLFTASVSPASSVQNAQTSALSSSYSSTAYINGTFYGSKSVGTYASGSEVVSATESSSITTIDEYKVSSMDGTTTAYTSSSSIASQQYYAPQTVTLSSIQAPVGMGEITVISTAVYYYNFASIRATLTLGSNIYYWNETTAYHWTPNTGDTNYYVDFSPSFSVTSEYYGSASLAITLSPSTTYGGWTNAPVTSWLGTIGSTSFTYNTELKSNTPINYAHPWTYSSVTASTGTVSQPSGIEATQFYYSSPYALEATGGGQTSSQATSNTLTYSSSPPSSWTFQDVAGDPDVTSFNVSWSTPNVVQSVSESGQSFSSSYTLTQSGNWWNSSFSITATPPSGWLNGATEDGAVWGTTFSYSVNHILSVGYGTWALTDSMAVTGFSSHTFNPPQSKYESFSGTATVNSQKTASFSVDEFITYRIATVATPPDYSTVTQSPVPLTLSYSSPIALKEITLNVLGNLADRFTSGLGTSGSVNYSYIDPSFAPLTVSWELSTGEYTQYVNLTYGGSTSVPENSSSVVVLQSDSVTHSYPITLTGAPSDYSYPISLTTSDPNSSLSYQQQITISNPSQYGINSAGSNIKFFYPSGQQIYAWEQSVNTSSMVVWLNLSHDINQTIYLKVYSQSDNFFSANGYLGEAPQLSPTYAEWDNGYSIFGKSPVNGIPLYYNFANLTNSYYQLEANVTLSNGLDLSGYLSTNLFNYGDFATNASGDAYFNSTMHFIVENHGSNLPDIRLQGPTSGQFYDIPYSANRTVSQPLYVLNHNGLYQVDYGATVVKGSILNATIPYLFFTNSSIPMPSYSIGTPSTFAYSGDHYQQLITLNTTNAPNIMKGLNGERSNFQITLSNGTASPTWIQAENSTSITFWSKLPYSSSGSEAITMLEYPEFENLFSANLGGYNLSTDNGGNVFGSLSINGSSEAGYQNYIGSGQVQNSAYYLTSEGLLMNTTASTHDFAFTAPAQDNQTYSFYSLAQFVNGVQESIYAKGYSSSTNYPLSNGTVTSATGVNAYNGIFLNAYYTDTAAEMYIKYAFVIPTVSMPTFTVGAGSDFMANASTTSSFQGTPGNSYNSTWQYVTYNIPLGPGSNFTTVLINSSWGISNLFPSTYKVFTNPSTILFDNLTGFSSIQVSTIQPSQLIGQGTPVSLSLEQMGTNDTISSFEGFTPVVTYTPFGSASLVTVDPGSLYFNLPYGSTASVRILNYWQQTVGSASFSVDSSSIQETIPLNVSVVTFYENTTSGKPLITSGAVSVRSGSYNYTGNPAIIANGSSYEWYASLPNPSTGIQTLYSGTVKGNSSSQSILVDVGAPISTLIVNANSYNGSGYGPLSTAGPASGNPTANLYINNVSSNFGNTFIGSLDEKVNVRITDILGQLLFETNLTLSSPVVSETYNITVPSYVIGIYNNQNNTATQSTQYVDVKENGTSGPWYNFTTRKNQEAVLYLKAGEIYYLHTYDSVNTTKYITLSNTSIYYIFNNTNIYQTVQSAFPKAVGISFSSPTQNMLTNTTYYFFLTVTYPNGTIMDKADTQYIITLLTNGQGQVDLNENNNFNSLLTPYYIQPGKIGLKYNFTVASQYSISVTLPEFTLNNQSLEPPNPNPQVSFTVSYPQQTFSEWLHTTLGAFSFYGGIIVTAIALLVYFIRVLRYRHRQAIHTVDAVLYGVVSDGLKASLSSGFKAKLEAGFMETYGGLFEKRAEKFMKHHGIAQMNIFEDIQRTRKTQRINSSGGGKK